jgi:hypothetical protein
MDTNTKNNRQGKTVKLRPGTLDRLNKLRHKGQSYDGVITELLDFREGGATEDLQDRSFKRTRNEDNGA